jgi:hypothetical protein
MKAQDVILSSRVAHVRELKSEIERLKAENLELRNENTQLKGHFAMALLAAEDLRNLPEEGRFIIVDGWNAILGATKDAENPKELISLYKRHLEDNPRDFVWIVFDGHTENSKVDGRLRVSYTGGEGLHRADRFICDFLRMAKFSGGLPKIEVKTRDKDFIREIRRLLGGSKK